MKRAAAMMAMAVATLVAPAASAQEYLIGASGAVASGVEGGGGAHGLLQRARTRLRLGADLRVDESPQDIFAFGLLLDVEPRAAFGLDVRYMRLAGKHFALDAGAIGYLAPGTLIGPSVGLQYRAPLGTSAALTAGPQVNVFVLGTDLPDGNVIWQGLLEIGIRADL